MSSLDYYECLQLLSLSALSGLLLTIFYKKDFTVREHVAPLWKKIVSLAFLWWFTLSYDSVYLRVVTSGITPLLVWKEFHDLAKEEKIKSAVLSLTMVLISRTTGDFSACLTVFCALTQLLRWPTPLKNYLREFRIIFGPVYVLLAAGSYVQSRSTSNLLTISVCITILAATFLRPDNNECLRFFVVLGAFIPSTTTRKWVHGFLMFLSMICVMLYLAISSNVQRMFVFGATFIGAFNVLLYIFAADFPRKIWSVVRSFARRRFAA